MNLTPEQLKARRQLYYRRWLAKKTATPELAEAYRQHRNRVARTYTKRKRAEDPVWRQRYNTQQNLRYHTKVKHRRDAEFREKMRAYAKRRREELRNTVKRQLQQVLGGACVQCGITDPRLLDFDHIDPLTKTMLISQELHRPYEELLEEVKKCQLLCPNCHRLKNLEQGQLNSYIRKNREYRNKNRTVFSLPDKN